MDQQDQRNQQQDSLERKFLVLPFKVVMDERLTLADKLVYARALFFDEFFESTERTAELLQISVKQVQTSKRKLESIGLLNCICNTGRGKRYIALLPGQQGRVEKSSAQTGKICHSDRQNLPTEYKERLNGEKSFNSSFDKSKEDEQARNSSVDDDPLNEEQPKRYGNEDVNAMLDLWESETGFSHHKTKAERYAMSGLIRQYGCEALKALIRRVGRARRSDNRFAPQIAKPSQLRGKYSKLEALTIWEERMDKESANESTGPDLQKLYATPSEYLRDDPEPTATKEELHEAAEAIRESYRGTKYEHIFCHRKMGGQK